MCVCGCVVVLLCCSVVVVLLCCCVVGVVLLCLVLACVVVGAGVVCWCLWWCGLCVVVVLLRVVVVYRDSCLCVFRWVFVVVCVVRACDVADCVVLLFSLCVVLLCVAMCVLF